jgi:dienelactone hydrolase
MWTLVIFIILCLPISAGQDLAAQNRHQSLPSLADSYYSLGGSKMSEDGKWLIIKKIYDANRDTLLIFNSQEPGQAIDRRLKVGNATFLRSDYLLMQTPGQVELLNLSTQKAQVFKGAINMEGLKNGAFFLLHYHDAENKRLELRSAKGELVNASDHVSRFYTTPKNHVYAVSGDKERGWEVLFMTDHTGQKIYSSENEIVALKVDDEEKGMIISQKAPDGQFMEMRYFDLGTKTVYPLSEVLPVSFEWGFGRAIDQGSSYFLDLLVPVEKEDASLVDIWYGSDRKLEKKFHPASTTVYYVWEPKNKKIQRIGSDQLPTGINIGSDQYFLAFDKYLLNDFLTFPQFVALHIYRHHKDAFLPVDTVHSDLHSAPDGSYFMYKAKGKWCLYQSATGQKRYISEEGLETPHFSSDGKSVLFDGQGGLWRYDLAKGKLSQFLDFDGYHTSLINPRFQPINSFRFGIFSADEKHGLIIKCFNRDDNTSAYLLWKNCKSETIVPVTKGLVKNLQYNDAYTHFSYTLEDYNSPPKLFLKTLGKDVQMVYESNSRDTAIANLKQEILTYTNSDGVPLKGVLYYPLDYEPSLKHPMVVNIYQILSNKRANVYPVPAYSGRNSDGFNLRVLLEHGYFVYFPDIVFGDKGTGLSALDCVHHALDALGNHPSIDKGKIGLIGHSHGGYETNFISTHSDRFAAFVAGAGNSNIVRSYFSYNYNFSSPFYWQYETGQYKMNKAFSEDKELYFKNNPIHYADQVQAPVLLWTGKKDINIYWDQTMEFYIGLKRNNKKVVALFYPNEPHALMTPAASRDLYSRTLDWFNYFLKGEINIDWIDREIFGDMLPSKKIDIYNSY